MTGGNTTDSRMSTRSATPRMQNKQASSGFHASSLSREPGRAATAAISAVNRGTTTWITSAMRRSTASMPRMYDTSSSVSETSKLREKQRLALVQSNMQT